MVKEFGEFSFNGKKGDKKVVKTQFGYHYIEILDQKNFEMAYKIAQLSKKIETSPETDQAASGLANQFAGEQPRREILRGQYYPERKPTASCWPRIFNPRNIPSPAWDPTVRWYAGSMTPIWEMYRSLMP